VHFFSRDALFLIDKNVVSYEIQSYVFSALIEGAQVDEA